jgi:hypothetical protein
LRPSRNFFAPFAVKSFKAVNRQAVEITRQGLNDRHALLAYFLHYKVPSLHQNSEQSPTHFTRLHALFLHASRSSNRSHCSIRRIVFR